jgi:tetratricopeptide (TPR) repeat protein
VISARLQTSRVVALGLAAALACMAGGAEARKKKHAKLVTPPVAAAPTAEETTAETVTETAKKSFVTGSEHYAAGRYAEAAAEFQKAYDLTRSPEILYNIGRCHEELKDDKQAIADYETYLSLAPAAPDAEDVRKRIVACKEMQKQREAEEQQARAAAEKKAAEDKARQEAEAKQKAEAAAWAQAVRLGLDMGVGVPLTGDAVSMNLPLEFFLHYPVLDWLYVTGVLNFYTIYFNDAKTYDALYDFGILVGVMGLFPLNGLLAATAKVNLGFTEVVCPHDKLTWIPVKASGGLEIRVVDSFRIVIDAVVAAGPVFNPSGRTNSKLENPEAEIELQLKAGAEYVF